MQFEILHPQTILQDPGKQLKLSLDALAKDLVATFSDIKQKNVFRNQIDPQIALKAILDLNNSVNQLSKEYQNTGQYSIKALDNLFIQLDETDMGIALGEILTSANQVISDIGQYQISINPQDQDEIIIETDQGQKKIKKEEGQNLRQRRTQYNQQDIQNLRAVPRTLVQPDADYDDYQRDFNQLNINLGKRAIGRAPKGNTLYYDPSDYMRQTYGVPIRTGPNNQYLANLDDIDKHELDIITKIQLAKITAED